MTTQEIEDYINNYRNYPPEYKGRRDKSILKTLDVSYRYNASDNTITRREGRIDENGDFILTGLVKFKLDDPSNKVPASELDRDLRFIVRSYNDLMRDLEYPDGVIDENNADFSIMVSSVERLKELYYTKDHARHNLKVEDPKRHNRETSRLRHFLRKYKHLGGTK
jgi:hypothetical protein